MASTDVTAVPPPIKRRSRRRWVWLLLGVFGLLAGGYAGVEGWAAWQEGQARQKLAEDRLDDARQHVDQALRVRSRPSTLLLAARIARLQGEYSKAETFLNDCRQRSGMSEPLQLEWLLLRCQRGEVDELSATLLGLVDSGHSQSGDILEAISAVYMRQTRYLEAMRCLDRWLALAPDSLRVLNWHGWVSNQLDHRIQAISDYEKLLEIDPGRSDIRLRLSEIFVDSSRHGDALPHLLRLAEEQPDIPDVLIALARCRMVQYKLDDAQTLLDKVLDAHPDHAEALLERGKLELSRHRPAEAERWLRKALAVKPLNPEARFALHRSLQLQPSRRKDAEAELERWKQDRQSKDRLVRLLRTELDLKPKDPNLACETGELFLKVGEEQRGLFWLHRALALDPRHTRTHRALLAYYERTNNLTKADEERKLLSSLPRQ